MELDGIQITNNVYQSNNYYNSSRLIIEHNNIIMILLQYKFDAVSGEWSHREHDNSILNLTDVSFDTVIRARRHPKKVETVMMGKAYFDVCIQVHCQSHARLGLS